MTELKEMPSSLNDACRKLDAALDEIERLRAALKPFAEQNVSKMISLDELNLDKEDFERARAAYQQTKADAEF